jgi:hypothetical protein
LCIQLAIDSYPMMPPIFTPHTTSHNTLPSYLSSIYTSRPYNLLPPTDDT